MLSVAWQEGEALVRIRRLSEDAPSTESSELYRLSGSVLQYRVSQNRHCVGFGGQRAATYEDCFNRPQKGERTCVSCSVAEANHAGGLHHAHTKEANELDSKMASHLQQPNSLYLAVFRDGSIKVGTTTNRRHNTRLLEQGAWLAQTVATTSNGIEIRKIEDLVTQQLGIPQSVSIKRKLTGMATPSDEAALEAKLAQAAADVHRLLFSDQSLVEASPQVPAESEIWRYTDTLEPGSPTHTELQRSPFVYSAPLDVGAHHIEVHGSCGRITLVTKPNSTDYFVVDIGQLFGLELALGEHEPAAITVQDALF